MLWLRAILLALFTRDDEPIPYRATPTRVRFVYGEDMPAEWQRT